jgi:ADP-ribosyl-[dinitrogen reductase] hydrolase
MTFCPGKYQPAAATGSWDRDLATDLNVIRGWGASLVITLLEDHELKELRVAQLGDEVERRGMAWLQVAVPDVNVPSGRQRAHWMFAATMAGNLLDRGESVLIHCKGGLGRTGLAAAALLVEKGASPDDAIRAVRQARPDTIENNEQEAWVKSISPPAQPPRRDRLLGCLLGGAVGDAFGYEIEFNRLDEIRRIYGEAGLTEAVLNGGRLVVSDDKQMTMFTAEAMIRSARRGQDRSLVCPVTIGWYAYRRWLCTQGVELPETVSEDGWLVGEERLRVRRAPGNTCLSALNRPDPNDASPARNDSKGCGGVMRIAPVGLASGCFRDESGLFKNASDLARLTHGHPTGYLASGAMAIIVARTFNGSSLEEATAAACEMLRNHEAHEETSGKLEAALELAGSADDDHAANVKRLGEGWIAEEALAVGLYAALVGETFSQVLQIAANHDGDSDSTASIAGQLYGTEKGLFDLPVKWIGRLDVLDPLLVLAHDLLALDGPGTQAIEDYPPN